MLYIGLINNVLLSFAYQVTKIVAMSTPSLPMRDKAKQQAAKETKNHLMD